LFDKIHRENRGKHVWGNGITVRPEGRQERGWEVGGKIVPLSRNLIFVEENFFHGHSTPPYLWLNNKLFQLWVFIII
jgi:hypothetical protein